jgi:hypothetical protein
VIHTPSQAAKTEQTLLALVLAAFFVMSDSQLMSRAMNGQRLQDRRRRDALFRIAATGFVDDKG